MDWQNMWGPYAMYGGKGQEASGATTTPSLIPTPQTTGGTTGGSNIGFSTVGTTGGGGWTPPSEWGARNLWSEGSGEYDPNEFAWGGATPQNWWRSPDMAGGVIYNDQYGWQLADPVREWYRQYQTAPTSEQFGAAGWTPQGVGTTDVGSWKDYYPDRNTDAGWRAQGYGWNAETGQWEQGYQEGGGGGISPVTEGAYTPFMPNTGTDYSQYYGDITGTGGTSDSSGLINSLGGIQYPQEWDTASNLMTNAAYTGLPTQNPWQWNLGSQMATGMAATGMPVDQSASYQAQKAVAQQNIQDEINQAAERANLTGLRWSTPLGQSAQNIAGKYMTQLGASTTAQEAAAQEAARGRQQQAYNQMYQFGQGTSGLTESAAGRQMSAAGQLPGIGSLYAQYPMQLAQQGMQTGTALQQAQQAGIAPLLQEFLRTTPEASPWLTYAMQAVGLPFQSQPQMYQPSGASQALGTAGSLAGLFAGCL